MAKAARKIVPRTPGVQTQAAAQSAPDPDNPREEQPEPIPGHPSPPENPTESVPLGGEERDAVLDIAGHQVRLDVVIAKALKASGKTLEEWNELHQDARELEIQQTISRLEDALSDGLIAPASQGIPVGVVISDHTPDRPVIAHDVRVLEDTPVGTQTGNMVLTSEGWVVKEHKAK